MPRALAMIIRSASVLDSLFDEPLRIWTPSFLREREHLRTNSGSSMSNELS